MGRVSITIEPQGSALALAALPFVAGLSLGWLARGGSLALPSTLRAVLERVTARRGASTAAAAAAAAASPECSSTATSAAAGREGPRHLAVIMDGNRRYARSRRGSVDAGTPLRTALSPRLPPRRHGRDALGDPLKGHEAGASKLLEFIEWCAAENEDASAASPRALTFFAFSSENFDRPPHEVDVLMAQLVRFCAQMRDDALSKRVRVRFLTTDRGRLQPHVRAAMEGLERATACCDGGLHISFAVSYGARQELVGACQALAKRAAAGEIDAAAIDAEALDAELTTAGLPPVDMLIRTSGEQRLSNFLLYQLAYAELFFVDEHWPAITRDSLRRCLGEFAQRRRRFGR